MPPDPQPFTEAQRELFGTVAKLNRAKPDTFREADRWIDTPPPTDQAKYERFRDAHLAQSRERRTRRDRSYGIELSRPEPGYGIVTYCRHGWQQMPDEQRQQVLRDARNYYGANLRFQRRKWAERIREETEHGPLRRDELIDLAASRFTRTSQPLVFDAMNPQQKALWARRLLRVVWILTDTADLTTTELAWLREWKWGEHQLEFLCNWPDADMRPIPRLWLRVTTFDREIEEWERLTREALRALDDAEPGATTLPASWDAPAQPQGQAEPPAKDLSKEAKARARELAAVPAEAPRPWQAPPPPAPAPGATPPATVNKADNRTEWLAKAMLMVRDHPDWSDAEISRRVGKSPGTLSRSDEYQMAAKLARGSKADRPKGYVTVDPDSGAADVEGVAPPTAPADDRSDRGKPIPGSRYFREYCAECKEPMGVTKDKVGTEPLCEHCAQ